MKKLLLVLLVIMLSACMLVACNLTPSEPNLPSSPSDDDTVKPDFTANEKERITSAIGELIPYLSADEYTISLDINEQSNELFLNGDVGKYLEYNTIGTTKEQFEEYLKALKALGYKELEIDLGDGFTPTTYIYQKGDIFVSAYHYTFDSVGYVDAYIWLTGQALSEDTPVVPDTPGGETPDNPDNPGGETPDNPDNPGGETPVNPPATNKLFTDFSSDEKQDIINLVGEVFPFLPTDDYAFEVDTDEYGDYILFQAYNNTTEELEAYFDILEDAGYTFSSSEIDDEGDTWYYYDKGDICLDIVAYTYGGEFIIQVMVYPADSEGGEIGGGTTGGTTGGGSTDGNITHLTNNGKGLPSGTNGVYSVDFTDATYVKYVADQGYYLGGCPTTGNVKVLVIPVDFSDESATSKGYTLDKLDKAFNSNDAADGMLSAYEYFKTSSYGKLSLNFVIPTSWYRASSESTYYANQTDSEGGLIGDQILLDEALKSLANTMDLSQFDSDDNGLIDAVVMINSLEIGEDDFHWAYRYWNQYFDNSGNCYEYDGVSANDYLWASYKFLYEAYDSEGQTYYDENAYNTYTFIHEFSHVLGADDYYDTAYIGAPLDGQDMMDSMFGDHNPYTKFNYGWLTTSRLVVAEDSVTLTLEDFSKNGDTIIVANNWDATLGAYQEYYVLMYYTENGVNAGDEYGFFAREGVVVYHVNASLYKEVLDGETYYDVYNNNTDASDEYGTEDNLIELVKSANDTFTYIAGDTSPTIKDDNGNTLAYSFVIDSIEGDTATITFTKNNN